MKKISNFIFVLSILLLFSYPLGVLVRLQPFPNVAIYPQDLLVGAVSLTILTYHLLKRQAFKYKGLILSIAIFNIVALFSLLIGVSFLKGNEIFVSLMYLIRLDAYLVLLFIGTVGLDPLQIKLLKRIFMSVSIVTLFAGYIQLAFYNNLKNLYYLGWDEHLYRMFSSFLDPNFAGLLFSLLLIVVASEFISNSKKSIRDAVFWGALLIFVALALVLTYSRTALLSTSFGLVILFTMMRKTKLMFIFFSILLVAVFVLSDLSIEGLNPLRIVSSEARISSMKETIYVFEKYPLLGVGFNSYRYAQVRLGLRSEAGAVVSNADAGADNSFLFVLATTGIIGLVAYLAIWLNVFKVLGGLRLRLRRTTSVSVILSLFLGSFFINALFYAPIMLWVFFYIGIFNFSEKEKITIPSDKLRSTHPEC